MNEDRWLERLRHDAAGLRFDADDIMLGRLAARVRERVADQPSIAGVLFRWFGPLAASLAALSIVAMIGITYLEKSAEPSVEEIAATADLSLEGGVYSVGE